MTNLLAPMVNNQDVSAAFFNTTIDNMLSVKFLVADLVVNNNALLQTSPELSLQVPANSKYIFDSCLFYDTTAAADFQVGVFSPVGTITAAFWSSGAAITTAVNSLDQSGQIGAGSAVAATCGGVAAGTVLTVRPAGYIEMSNSSGAVAIGYAQGTATAVNSYLKQGSWIALTRVG